MIKKALKKFTALTLVSVMMLSMAGCEKNRNSAASKKEQEKFDAYLKESFEETVTSDTLTLHYSLAHPENYGLSMDEVTFGEFDVSEETLLEEQEEIKEGMKELEAFDYERLTDEQQVTYDILDDLLDNNLKSYEYVYFVEPFAYTTGIQVNLPITMAEYTFYDEQDVKDYIELLNEVPSYFQECLDFEKTKSEKGYFMSDANADEVIRQCKEYIQTPDDNLLIATFNDRIGDVPGLSAEQIEDYKKQNEDAVKLSVIPAYENVISVFEGLKGTCKNENGLSSFENGKEYYQYLLKSSVGTDKSADEVAKLLDREIMTCMTEVQGIATLNYEATMKYFEESGNLYDELDHEETVLYFEKMCTDKFPDITDISFTVKPVHKSLEKISSPAFYMIPPMDDYKDNSIYINPGTDSVTSLWSTLAHEGIPGHMYQVVYFLSNDPEPLRTVLNFKGYTEGWATYVEMMSYGYYDKYTHDIYADLESVNAKLNLLLSARLDVGINYEGWNLDETKKYFETYGMDPSAADELYNYIVADPCLYPAYCVGWLEFEELKEYAEEKLKDKFNEVEFHKVILDAGPCPFYILDDMVDDYIESNK